MVLIMKRMLSMILALLIISCSLPAIITSYAEDSNNLAADYTNAGGQITWSDNAGVYKSSIDGTANSVYGGHSWRFGIPETSYKNNKIAYIYIKTGDLVAGKTYEFSYIYQKDYVITFDSITDKDNNAVNLSADVQDNIIAEGDRAHKISVTFTAPVDGNYTFTLKMCKGMNNTNCAYDSVILCDLSLTETTLDTPNNNLAADYTNANGLVTWSDNSQVRGSSIDSTTNSVKGGHSWKFGIGETKFSTNPAYVYITATDLKANTIYDFSYIYQGDFVIVFDNIKDKDNANISPLSPSNDVEITGGDRAHQVTTTFKIPADGDYTITLKMGKGNNNINCKYDAVVLSDLELWVSDGKGKLTADIIISGNGDATVSNKAPTLDDEITFTATPWEGEEFLGWYNGNEKVSDELLYTFNIDRSIVLTAKFTTKNPNALAHHKVADWFARSYGSVAESSDSSRGGKAYLLGSVNYQKMVTSVKLNPNTTYNFDFDWKAILPDDNSGAGIFPSHIYVYPKSIVGELTTNRDANATVGSGKWNTNAQFFPTVGDGKLDANDDIESASDAYYDKNKAVLADGSWNSISTNFKTTNDTEYVIMITFRPNAIGQGKNQIILSDFKLEKTAENLAADYTNANGNVTWTENSQVRGSSIDSTLNSVYGGHSWGFGIPETQFDTKPAYVYIQTGELTAGERYEFSFVYQKDYLIFFDSIDSDAIVTSNEDVKLADGDRAHRVTVLFNVTKTGSHKITLKMGKGKNNENCKYDKVILSDLRLYEATNRVYGRIKAERGGVVSGFDSAYCAKSDKVVIKAVPNMGNTFDGWFNIAGELISADAEYKFTAENDFNLTAKFSGNNIPNSEWLSEHGMDGTFENGTMSGWKAEDRTNGDDSSWAVFERSDFTSYNGSYALRCVSRYRTSFFRFDDLKKHTDYLLSFYVCLPDENEEALIKWFSITNGGVTLYTDPSAKAGGAVKGGSGWHKVNIYFNTAEFTSVDWNFYYTNGYGHVVEYLKQFVYLDDISLVEYNAQDFANGDFENGANSWRGAYLVSDGAAKLDAGNSMYQPTDIGKQNLYTVSFKAKGKGLGGFAEITKDNPNSCNYISSESVMNLNSTDWKNYSFKFYSGINPHASFFFKAIDGELLVDDVSLTLETEKDNAVVEKVDFETERFALHNKSDVFELYNGTNGDANVYSGSKSLRFNSSKAEKGVEYILDEAFLSAQIAARVNYRLTLYYKITKGNSLYIAPEYLVEEGTKTTYTAAGNGWTKVDFMFSKTTSAYIKTIIKNILNETKGDFYIDDITLTVAPPMVLETNSVNKYCDWPLNVLYNQGFEEKITKDNWANLPKTAELRTNKGAYGDNYLRFKASTYYVLPVEIEAGGTYYFSVSSRLGKNSSGYVAVASNPEGTKLYDDINGKAASKIAPDTTNWNRDAFLFSTNESGIVYLVFAVDKGYIDVDEVCLYKRQYGKDTDPNDHDFIAFDFNNPNKSLEVLDGGDPTFSGDGVVEDGDKSPATGDSVALPIALIIISVLSVVILAQTKEGFSKNSKGGKA